MKRRLTDRIKDRLWREVRLRMACDPELPSAPRCDRDISSISGTMPWIDVCAAYAGGGIGSHNFRRYNAVCKVVETVAPVDGGFYAGRIRQWAPEMFHHPEVLKLDAWGNPIRCPRFLLSTNRPYSPTTMRYLATALWLKREGFVTRDTNIVEIGVGFGGLAAMNAVVSGAKTFFVDLPPVSNTAVRMLSEIGLAGYGFIGGNGDGPAADLLVSNYAFTELSADLQDIYLHEHLSQAKHGVIVSNASVFASSINGRNDEELTAWLNSNGIPARMEITNELLSPIDALCRVCMIRW